MQTEPYAHSQTIPVKEIMLNDEFIVYINTLSDSIKEFYKVSNNVNKNKNLLINLAEGEINQLDSLFNKIFKEETNNKNLTLFNNIIEKVRDIFNRLKLNVISEEKNLIFFFEDAKVLFKKMKEKRQNLILKLKTRSNSTPRNQKVFTSSHNNDAVKYNQFKNTRYDSFTRSDFNCQVNNKMRNIRGIDRTERDRKSKTLNKTKESNDDNRLNNLINRNGLEKKKSFDKGQSNEIEKLKIINKRLSLELRQCKSKIAEKGQNFFDDTLKIENQDFNKIIKEKDLKMAELMKNINIYKREMQKINEENNKLKQYQKKSNNNNINNSEYSLKLNSLTKENNFLKNNIEELKSKINSSRSEFNYTVNTNDNTVLEKENEVLKIQNDKLNKEIMLLKNKHQTELSQLNKKNSDLSIKFKKNQNDLINLKKDNINKKKELENLKSSLSNIKNNNIINDSIDIEKEKATIIDNYKKENEQLKKTNSVYQDKINYYLTKIRNIKNELFEQMKTTMELENNNQNQIKKLKEEHENDILGIKNKNKKLESDLEEYKNFNSNLTQQINNLNQQIFAKEVKIVELNYQIEELNKQLKNKEEENKKLLDKIEKISNDIKNNVNKDEEIKQLNEKIEEQENLNNDLNEELSNLKKDNDLLKNKIMSNEKKINEFNDKQNENYDIDLLNNEIKNLKNENSSLKTINERLTVQLKEILDNNANNNNNISEEEKIRKKNEEIEGLKQLISKIQKEREKSDDEINLLKRENEKITNQIVRLSKKLPEEYNELQKQYNDLENKYLMIIKNKSGSLTASGKKSKNNDVDNIEEKLTKELQEARKEIDVLKKKNGQLVEQLEEKEIKKNCYDNKSEDANKSNYEEEFDLRKMAKGAREKNRSQDINIDYPGIQAIKEKYRELDFYYNSLEGLVKKLLLNISTTPKNKTYVNELCRIVGFDLETTNKILTNKNKKLILGLFTK